MTTFSIETEIRERGHEYRRLMRNGRPVSHWVPADAEGELTQMRSELEKAEARGATMLAALAGGFLSGLAIGQGGADPEVVAAWEEMHGGPWTDTTAMDEVE